MVLLPKKLRLLKCNTYFCGQGRQALKFLALGIYVTLSQTDYLCIGTGSENMWPHKATSELLDSN